MWSQWGNNTNKNLSTTEKKVSFKIDKIDKIDKILENQEIILQQLTLINSSINSVKNI